jgi:hypothetical protein
MAMACAVKFNIGGQVYQVSRSASGYNAVQERVKSLAQTNPESEIIIERNGIRFQYVLNFQYVMDFLRDGSVRLPIFY